MLKVFWCEVMSDRARKICILAVKNFLYTMKVLLMYVAGMVGVCVVIALIGEKPWSLMVFVPVAILIISFLNAGARTRKE